MKEKKRALIITGGSIQKELAENFLKMDCYDILIAVDKGLETTDSVGACPDYVVGDFDTVSAEILLKYRQAEKEGKLKIIEFVPEKDHTDTDIAIELAMKLQAEEIVILGGTGTRFDHVLANVNLLLKPLLRNIEAYLYDSHNKIYLINKNHQITRKEAYGKYVSLLPLTEKVKGVFLKNVKYPLNNATLVIGESLGVSNEIAGESAQIELSEGVLIVVEARD